ncbi:hypothetical protein DMH17_03575 [Raoultella planticola]|nr:hypothetical protein [Raoultella planticola]
MMALKWSHGRQLAQKSARPRQSAAPDPVVLPPHYSARRRPAKGGEVGGIVAPYLTKPSWRS